MPLIGFKKEFADLVESGAKRQTIRAPRKRPIKVGDTLYLYTGLRTKQCRKLGEGRCYQVIRVDLGPREIIGWGIQLSNYVAIRDGLSSYSKLAKWFRIGPRESREMTIIRWVL